MNSIRLPICEIRRLGLLPYQDAWELQGRYAREIAGGNRPPTLLLLEHPHTYTFGRAGRAENLLWDDAQLSQRGVQVHWVDRGGDVTYHGPGQLVGYPLLPLDVQGLNPHSGRIPQADYIGYLRKLERVLISALDKLGAPACRLEGLTGVWINSQASGTAPAKIAAIGVKVDARGITRHGFALNVDPDMSYWQGIIGCGIKEHPSTCLAEVLSPLPNIDQIIHWVVWAFGNEFQYDMIDPTNSS
ncbi:MAG: lipoyl(octanoyl) transferase LipB [Anaerolineales bacterium]|jgi:lipoyl(octanoyl) transferase